MLKPYEKHNYDRNVLREKLEKLGIRIEHIKSEFKGIKVIIIPKSLKIGIKRWGQIEALYHLFNCVEIRRK